MDAPKRMETKMTLKNMRAWMRNNSSACGSFGTGLTIFVDLTTYGAGQLENGEVHGDHQAADRSSEEHHEQRL